MADEKVPAEFLSDPSVVPKEVRDGHTEGGVKRYAAFKQVARRSNFTVLINPNISYKSLDEQGRSYLAQKLITAKNALTTQLHAGKCIIEKNHGIPKLLSVQGEVEIGQKNGFVHLMIVYKFDDYCWLDFGAVRATILEAMSPQKSVAVKVAYFQDKGEVMAAYATKSADDDAEELDKNDGFTFAAGELQPSG